MFTLNYLVESTDVDKFLDLKLSSLFLLFQKTATFDMEQNNIGKANTIDKGLYWVITRYSIKINEFPKYLDNISVTTCLSKKSRFLYQRDFVVKNNQCTVLITASSLWCVLDRNNNHSICTNPFPTISVPIESINVDVPSPRKVNKTSVDLVENRLIKYSDLDLHSHVSNIKYIDYILDIHSDDFYKKYYISEFDINYEHELLYGDILNIFSNFSLCEYISLKTDNKNIADINVKYQPKEKTT